MDWGSIANMAGLSGTPAEAGVRDDNSLLLFSLVHVSVEPLPKQGCEVTKALKNKASGASQWNPCRSRGAS